jgi:hypothetical protein
MCLNCGPTNGCTSECKADQQKVAQEVLALSMVRLSAERIGKLQAGQPLGRLDIAARDFLLQFVNQVLDTAEDKS